MRKTNVEDIYPLSPLQEGMLFHTLLELGSGLYLDQLVIRVEDPRGFDVGAFRFACGRLAERHSILRTAFALNWEKPLQIVLRQVELPVMNLDFRSLPKAAQRLELEKFLREDHQRGFDLAVAPLVRLTLISRAGERHDLVVTYHHALMDAWSIPIVFGELLAFYGACRRGEELDPPRPRPYRDYIAWLEKKDLRAAETFWRQQLAGFAAPTSLGVGRAGVAGGEREEAGTTLSAGLTGALEALARRLQATASALIQGAWALLLSRFSGEREAVFGITVSGRPPELEGAASMVGLFINTLPLRVRVEPEEILAAWLRRLLAQSFTLRLHEHTPLPDIRRWIGFPAHLPLFESIVVFENAPGLQPAGAAVREESFGAGESRYLARANYPLALVARPGRAMTLQLLYDSARFDRPVIVRMLRHLIQLLSSFPGSLERPLAELSLLSAGESAQILREWNATETAYPRRALDRLFAEQAERQPEAVAVVCGEEVLTYADLLRRASAVASELRRRCIEPEALIGLLSERSPTAVAAMLGVLEAGAAYLPLDPAWPPERLALVLRESGATIVLVEERFSSLVQGDLPAEVLSLDALCLPGGTAPMVEVPAEIVSDRLAYVMYTSGSTGTPKGVAVSHRGVVRLVRATSFLRLGPESAVLHAAPLTFDASTLEIWGPLLNGGRLVILPAGFSLAGLAETVRRHGLDVVWLPAGLFHEMVDQEDAAALAGVRHLLAGGDVLSPVHVRRALAGIPGCEVVNGYGPTENTTFTTTFRMMSPEQVADPVPIGRPIANTKVYVLDANFQPVPIGVRGELLAGGDGLARGYHRRPDLTAERFVPDPFSEKPGARLYLTGDIARWREDGVLEFLGRSDRQVKIRGFRIELGEVEAALTRQPGVRDAVVLAPGSPESGRRLVAFVALREDATLAADGLRAALERQLPAFMTPELFVLVDSLPLTPNGKVDRKALASSFETGVRLPVASGSPRNPLELALVRIWESVLARPVGIHERFLEIGGQSLLALRLLAHVRRRFGVDLPLASFFSAPTVAGMAELLRGNQASYPSQPASSLVALQPEGSLVPFFCAHPGGGNVFCYTALAYHLGRDRPFYGLRARGREEGEEPLTTVAGMAALYLEAIRKVRPRGPYHLGGWSFGGLVAFEMAQQLTRAGEEVGLLAMLDCGLRGHSEESDDAKILSDLLGREIGVSAEELRSLGSLDAQLERALEELRRSGAPLDLDLPRAHSFYGVYKANAQAARAYEPVSYPGRLTLFRAAERPPQAAPPHEPTLGWGAVAAGGVEIIDIPAHHEDLVIEPHVRILADRLRERLSRKEEGSCSLH